MEAPVFEEIYRDYLARVRTVDTAERAALLGVSAADGRIEIPLYNRTYTVTPEGIESPEGNKPHHAVSVILCQYILLCPNSPATETELVTFKDFMDAAPFVGGFRNSAEAPIAKHFAGSMASLEECAAKLGGKPCPTEVSCDLALRFPALPKVPIYLLFNDEDDEFPADCTLLFQRGAEKHLDMECLAMLGGILAEWLKR